MEVKKIEHTLPLLPLRGLLVFPTMVLHLDVGRERSVVALDQAMVDENLIMLVTQKDAEVNEPAEQDLFTVGVIAKIRQMLKLPNGTIRVLVEGLKRASVLSVLEQEKCFIVRARELLDTDSATLDTEALMRSVLDHFEEYIRLSKKISRETFTSVSDITEPGRLSDVITSHLPIKVPEKQAILEHLDVRDRLETLLNIIHNEREVLELERTISVRVKKQMEKTQKEYYLREQMKAIQRELGDKEGRAQEVEELRERLQKLVVSVEVKSKIKKEIDRLEKIPLASAEGGVIRSYVDWLLDLPWNDETPDELHLENAECILNEDHYGLEKIKERILEYLAVRKMVKKLKGPILCLVGPPGVGKTSLVRSVARALSRQFVRISLGGVRDEAEIRGHRRTYVGAMPGRVIQGMKSAGVLNPVFLLDEIDKMAMDFRGDPASALLEVLDPSQNTSFSDHYIELPFDLSKVMFVTTANAVHSIPRPLLDRMEVIYISGYTEQEKEQIARSYLIPKQLKEHGLTTKQVQLQKGVMQKVIRNYTREAGVRNLERMIGTLCRKSARLLVANAKKRVVITMKNLDQFLGAVKYTYGVVEEDNQVGVATGLAWTEVGGDTLLVEVSLFPGTGKLVLTGQLGEVMKESAQAAFSYIRSRSEKLKVDADFHEKHDIHIHVPEGAIPKDGPSAGITIATALVSALTGVPVSRLVAMTGEITLRGRVLPIGGLKEKALSAHRAGIKKVLLPKGNEKDICEIPKSIQEELALIPVNNMDEVIEYALVSDCCPQ